MAQQSPLLDQYNQDGIVTPQIQRAIDMVKQKLPQFQGLPAQDPGQPRLQAPSAPVPSISRGTEQPAATPWAPSGPPMPTPASTPESSHVVELNRLTTPGNTGGISQVHNPVARGLLRAADVFGSMFAPGITAAIPGTDLHHNYLVKRAEGTVNQDVARAKENAGTAEEQARATNENLAAPGARAHTEAETNEANARTESLKNPPKGWKESAEPAVDPAHPELGPQHFFFNESDPSQRQFGGPMAAKPTDKPEVVHEFTDKDGKTWQIHADGTASAITANGKQLEGKTTEKPLEDRVVTEYQASHPGVSLAEARRATAVKEPTSDIGTWTLQEDKDGKPVLMNSKTAEVKPVEGVQKAGTAAKATAATEKEQGPAKVAIGYARDYAKNGKFTGPGDEALQEKFFELAKPATGFRMTQPQMQMLQDSRSWMEGAVARLRHATTGTWFSDEQRKQIIGTMEDLAAQKLGGGAGSVTAAITATNPQTKEKVESTDGGKTWHKPQ